MDMYYWTGFSKRENSTKKPSDTGTKVEILLKEDTSIDAPSIVLTGNVLNLDYCYIPDFGKYYFVGSPIILANDMTQYDLVEDTLATHKTEIGNTVAHIAYSTTGFNKHIVDSRMAVKGSRKWYQTFAASPFDSDGCFVISVVNDEQTGRYGNINYYLISAYDLYLLNKWMMKDDIWNQIKQYFNGKSTDLIQGCKWFPISHSKAKNLYCGTTQTTFWIGSNEVADYSTTPPTPILITHDPISSIVHELSDSQGYITASVAIGFKWDDFRDCQPYTSASLFLPGVGVVDININDFYGSANVNIQALLDITTGDLTYRILDDAGNLVKTISFNASVDVALTQITTNVAGVLAGIGGTVGGITGMGVTAATGNAFGVVTAGVGAAASGAAAVMAANQRSTSIKGTNNGRSAFYNSSYTLTLCCLETEDIDATNYKNRIGRPVCETHAISNHSGYVQCEAASASIAGDSFERETINRFLNSGFYYE